MKTIIPLLLLCITVPNFGQSKEELSDIESLLWFGIDFSMARFVGKTDFKSPYELKEKFIPEWNQLMLNEWEKYNIPEFFHVNSAPTDFGDIYSRNAAINEEEIIVGIDGIRYNLSEENIQDVISEYKTESDGYGLVFIVESFNKTTQNATIWVTYFHIPSKKVVFTKKMSGEPMGFGIRNYWGGAIYKIMKNSSNELNQWF